MEYYVSDPGLQQAGEMLLEDLEYLEVMINDLDLLTEKCPRLEELANDISSLIDQEIRKKRKLIFEIAEAHIH